MIKNFIISLSFCLLTGCAAQQAQTDIVPLKAANAPVEIPADVFGIHLYRHAEKQTGHSDPDLTDYGKARAEFMADHLSGAIKQVWSSDYVRSRETARPLAEKLGVEIQLYDPRDLPALSKKLLEEKSDAVVIGHSNTTPELAAILCGCEIEPMHESDYERGFLAVFGTGVEIVKEFDMRKMWSERPEKPKLMDSN
jgi:phosphohistidine phosphatase SixA